MLLHNRAYRSRQPVRSLLLLKAMRPLRNLPWTVQAVGKMLSFSASDPLPRAHALLLQHPIHSTIVMDLQLPFNVTNQYQVVDVRVDGVLFCPHVTQWLCFVVAYASFIAYMQRRSKGLPKTKAPIQYEQLLRAKLIDVVSPKTSVESLSSMSFFDYKSTAPAPYRPFKTRRHVVMGLKKILKTVNQDRSPVPYTYQAPQGLDYGSPRHYDWHKYCCQRGHRGALRRFNPQLPSSSLSHDIPTERSDV